MKNKYSQLCEEESTIPVFSQPWWLDAVCGPNDWDVVLIEKGGKIWASMPYYMPRAGVIAMPQLTQTMGPWLRAGQGSYAKNLSRQKTLMTALIEQLPRFSSFRQNFHYSVTNWLPFYWKDFKQTTRYTYTINIGPDYDPLAHFTSNMRNKVRKAEKLVCVQNSWCVDKFYDLNAKTFNRQGMAIPYGRNLIKRLDSALNDKGQRTILAAIDANGNPHSALYLIWDEKSAYVHMVGEDPELRSSGAGILLIERAIRHAISKGLATFDFEGSMNASIEIVRRSCGGIQTPYFSVSKDNRSEFDRQREEISRHAGAFLRKLGLRH